MLIRLAASEDIPAWLALSREYDKYISELTDDMAQWYDGFDAYVARKIAQREALIATRRELRATRGLSSSPRTTWASSRSTENGNNAHTHRLRRHHLYP